MVSIQMSLKIQVVTFFSYGSGCGAVLMRARFSRKWSSMTRFLKINEMLDNRLRLSVEEYERLVDGKAVGKNCLGKSFFKFDGVLTWLTHV